MAQAVERAIEILEICSHAPSDIGTIAERLGVHRSTASRLISTLESRGLLQRVSGNKFRIGYGFYVLWLRTADDQDTHAVIERHLKELAADTGFSVHCAIHVNDRLVSLDFIEPPYSIRLPLKKGGDVVVNTAGVAKAILAFMPEKRRERILESVKWERFTERTIVDPDEFKAVLERVEERGWAYDDGEYEDISNCIAAPFFDVGGDVAGAISLTSFKAQTPLSSLKEYVPVLLEHMDELSEELGHITPRTIRANTTTSYL